MAGEQGRAGVFNGRRQKAPGFPTPALHDLPGSGPAILYNLLEETKAVVKYLHRILTFQKIRLILAWKDIPSKLNTSYLWLYSFAFFALPNPRSPPNTPALKVPSQPQQVESEGS